MDGSGRESTCRIVRHIIKDIYHSIASELASNVLFTAVAFWPMRLSFTNSNVRARLHFKNHTG